MRNYSTRLKHKNKELCIEEVGRTILHYRSYSSLKRVQHSLRQTCFTWGKENKVSTCFWHETHTKATTVKPSLNMSSVYWASILVPILSHPLKCQIDAPISVFKPTQKPVQLQWHQAHSRKCQRPRLQAASEDSGSRFNQGSRLTPATRQSLWPQVSDPS